MGVSSRRRQFKIYGPAHFRATWEKFLEICDRDNQSASELIRGWVQGYVARKDPGNPQPPITAFLEGHEDMLAFRRSTIIKNLVARAESHGGEVHHREVVTTYRELGMPGYQLAELVESMEADLKRLGVKVIY